MLKYLMSRIAQYEQQLDSINEENGEHLNTERRLSESSFSPCPYPPSEVRGEMVPPDLKGMEDDQLYLPCHYFTFAGGTSTGG